MENLKPEVLSGFEIIPKSVVKSKHSYICKTNRGIKVIQKTNAKENSLIFSNKVKITLENKGYPIYDKFYISTQGTPFFICEGEKYIMTDFMDFTESDFSNSNDVKDVIKATATFHKFSRDLNIQENNDITILHIYEKQLANFKNIKKNISSKGGFSDFDVLFIKNYDYFLNKAVGALNLLKEIFNSADFFNRRVPLCHNNIKEETAVKYKDNMTLISFENISRGLFISDFSDIINRYIRKHTSPALSFENILETYFNINPLSDRDIKILQAMLKFPAKYIKICCDFYSKGMPFVPNSVVNHLKCIISQKNLYENYTNCL